MTSNEEKSEFQTAKSFLASPVAKASRLLRFFRLNCLVVHMVWGLLIVALIYPFISYESRLAIKQRWSRQLLALLGIRLSAQIGDIPAGTMFVANHISWIDVFVINALCPAAFIAKAEVRRWPLLGWLCERTDTLFLQRGSHRHIQAINAVIIDKLKQGRRIGIFPEGTTTDGSWIRPFHGALLQPAVDAGAPVIPLSITYRDENRRLAAAVAFVGEDSMLDSFRAIASARYIEAELVAYPALEQGLPRGTLARSARAVIAAGLQLSEPKAAEFLPAHREFERGADPQDEQPITGHPTDSQSPEPADWA